MITLSKCCTAAALLGAAVASAPALGTDAETAPRPLRERVATHLRDRGWPDSLTIAAIAALPVIELRGAVPVGINVLRRDWRLVLPIAILGNMIPVPFILLLLGPLSRALMRFRWGRRFFDWLFARTRRKAAGIEKYETLGLAIFVAIPLPATGAWTGAIAAFLMGIRFHHAMWSITLGVVIAGAIMTALSLLGWLGAAIAGAALLALAVGALSRALRREESRGAIPPTT